MQARVIGGVLVLIAAAIALFFLLRGGDEKKPTHKDDVLAPANGPKLNAAPGEGRVGSGVGAPTPRSGTGTGTGTSNDGVKTYVTDTGNLVRDHRANVTDPKAVPAPMPPEQQTMSSNVTAEIYRTLAPVVRACGQEIDASAKGTEPVVHVTLSVDVAGEKLTFADATAVTTDINGPAADKVIACVRDRANGLTVDAKGEPDRTGYIVQYPLRIR